MFYPGPIHDYCTRKDQFDKGEFAEMIGDDGCLALLGCKGFIATSDCYKRQWNNAVNWCIDAGAPCHACSEPAYPDHVSPLYGVFPLTNKAGASYGQLIPNRQTEFPVKY
jgi:hydrogenase small subunit